MWVWWFLIFTMLLLGGEAGKLGRGYVENGVTYRKSHHILFFLAVGLLIFFAGLRSPTGDGVLSIGDTRVYNDLFHTLVKDSIVEYIRTTDFEGDWGFYALMTIFHQVFGVESQGLFFICSLITIGCLLYRYYRLDLDRPAMMLFLFITFGLYMSTMNGVRQWLVSAIMFLAFPMIQRRKLVSFLLLAVVLSTVHQSAIFYIVLYFVAGKKAWGKVTIAMIVFVIVLFVFYPVVGPVISSVLESGTYSQYSQDVLSSGGRTSVIRFAIYVLPLALAWRYRSVMKAERYYDIITNMAVLDMLFMMLALTNWIYARLCIYLDPFLLIVYLWDLKYAFAKNSLGIAKIFFLIVWCAYFAYQVYVGYGGQIYTSQILGIGIG